MTDFRKTFVGFEVRLSAEVLRVLLRKLFPLLWQVVERKDRRNGAHGHTSAAVNAFDRVYIEHLFGSVLFGILLRMNAVHRAGVNARGVFCTDTGLGNYVGHKSSVLPRNGKFTETTKIVAGICRLWAKHSGYQPIDP